MAEELPLATVHSAVLKFLQGRDDAAVFGAQAVNAYVRVARMTQDVDLISPRGKLLSYEICSYLHDLFRIAVRVRAVAGGEGHRVYQLRASGNRNLVDVRQVSELPACRRMDDILVVAPADLLAMKVISMVARSYTPKGLTDEADSLRLLITFPELRETNGEVFEALRKLNAGSLALQRWQVLIAQPFSDDSDEY